MTNIDLYKKDGFYTGFKSIGHAEGEFDRIVCSSISTLTQTLYFTLINKFEIEEKDIVDTQGDGLLIIKIPDENIYRKREIQTCFEFMITGIELINEAYPQYLTLKIMEVQND